MLDDDLIPQLPRKQTIPLPPEEPEGPFLIDGEGSLSPIARCEVLLNDCELHLPILRSTKGLLIMYAPH